MYAACYANFNQARDTIDDIPIGKDLDVWVSYDTCQVKCVNRVDIGKRIDELKTI